jgi:hypothetical protein
MKWPPMVLYLKIRSQRTNFGLWLPLFILGPLFTIFLIAVFLIILPFVLVALLIAAFAVIFDWQTQWLKDALRYARWVGYVFRGVPAFVRVLCSLPGLKIDINGKREQVLLTFH